MASGDAGVLRQVQALFGVGTVVGMTDAELLGRFLTRHGDAAEVAFEAIVRRHGPMVLRVCRDVLGDPHAAEDACQATFLVLARKAGGIGGRERLGNWLYGVAYRTALKARAGAARRRRHEQKAAEMVPEAQAKERNRHDFAPVLHEEIGRLPERFRAPVVLCHLEGLSYAAAAGHLRVTEGTVRGRLARARVLLRDRLGRRGVAPAAGLGALASSRNALAVPAPLIEGTVRAAMQIVTGRVAPAGAVSAAVATLTQEVLRAMTMMRLKGITTGLLFIGGLVSGAGWLTHHALADRPEGQQEGQKAVPAVEVPDRDEGDRRVILGTWTTEIVIPRAVDGEPQPPLRLEETWVITGDRIVTAQDEEALKVGAVHESVYRYTLDPDVTPKAIDLTEPGWGTFPGIYELDGDQLRISYGVGERPTEFTHDDQRGPFLKTLKRVSPDPRPVTPLFATAPGGSWAIHPDDPGGATDKLTSTIGGVVLLTEDSPDGSLQVTLAHPVDPGAGPRPEYRAVAFDEDRRRYLLEPTLGGTGGSARGGVRVSLQRFRMDPEVLPEEEIAYLGVEIVTPGALLMEADRAFERAEAAGVEVLPPPRVGEPFEFALTTMDGEVVRSEDLRGKVVLIDCWASWCSPCMAKMPGLKALHERHDGGFEIVGVCFDKDAEKAKEAIESLGMTWPQVLVPDDEEVRRLWSEGSMIDGLPRLLVLDRRGVLRVDCAPEEVEEQVVRLLGEPGQPKP
ncbi:sigma-70 family RNA polymerase sigma factor [Tautonia plasticadhaerens]|uniref:ECF RNA polymerase sigma factor SigE n=1 Tax=Tautonia plasticadhaerens TaxID=2527974 RepID=A0A518H9P9_9BACT|nr:sigma-70 family RNA polymerase sigma factor [Tautonia plasticadhaerens]QDV37527.1 ECF RNA polymerase sigma factor SigE [Tautonia plasticadhaerens]